MGLMLFMGLLFSSSWLFFALLIMFMGLRHPPPLNDVTNLPGSRKAIGVAAALMLVLCFVPVPLDQEPVNYDFAFQRADGAQESVSYSDSMPLSTSATWQNTSFPFKIVNTGNMPLELSLSVTAAVNASGPLNVSARISAAGDANGTAAGDFSAGLGIEEEMHLTIDMTFGPVPVNATVTIYINETAYDWPNMKDTTHHPEEHTMALTVYFRRP